MTAPGPLAETASGGGDARRGSAAASDRLVLAKGAGVALLGRTSARFLMLLNQAVFARLLGPAGFGVFAIASSILQFAVNFAPLGLHQAIIRFGAGRWQDDPDAVRGVVRRCIGMAAASGAAAGFVLFLLSGWFADSVFEMGELGALLRWFSIACVAFALLRVVAAGTRLSRDMRYSVIAEDLVPPAIAVTVFVVLHFGWGWGLRGAAVATVVSLVAALLIASVLLMRILPVGGEASASAVPSRIELLSFSTMASLAGLFSFQSQRIDRLLVGYFMTADAAGIYQAAVQSASAVAMFLTAFNAIFSPMISGMYAQGEIDRLSETYRLSAKWGLYLSLPLFLTTLLSPTSVITVLFGDEFTGGATVLVIVLVGNLFAVSTGGVGLLLTMTGDQSRWFLYSAAMFFLNVVLGAALIPRFGLVGAAISTSIISLTLFSLGLRRAHTRLGVWPYDWRHLKGGGAALVAMAGIGAVKYLQPGSPAAELASTFVVATILMGTTLMLLGIDEEEREVLEQLRDRLRSRLTPGSGE